MTISVEEKDDKTSVLQHVTYACKLHKLEEGFSYCIAGYIYEETEGTFPPIHELSGTCRLR